MSNDLISRISLKQSIAISTILAEGKTLEQIIDEEPSIELVRCKDCKYVSVEPCKDYEDVYVCDRSYFTRAMGGNLPNDFCSYAERRKE